ncbi:MAG: HAD family hydrolase [Thermoplasmataceae archaeon]|jgi:histidinol-phosphate phosphatase family protein
MNKALFIDRDGTINHDCPYCKDPKDLRIYDDAVDIIKDFRKRGFLIVIVTNQSGINRGYFSEAEFEKFNSALLKELEREGAKVDAVYHCPHRPDEGCLCRKPGTGLLLQAARDLDIDLNSSFVVGDRDDVDGEMARRLGMKYMIIKHNESR